jgi:hypothetical protein
MIGYIVIGFLQEGSDIAGAAASLDWPSLIVQGGPYAFLVWLIYDNLSLRKENSKLNQESRDMAKSSVDALSRMAQEKRP